MKKRTLAAVLCVAALGLVAAGCGDDDESTTAAAPAATSTQEAAPTPTTEAAAGDLVAVASSVPDLSTLVTAVGAAGLVETLQGEGPFTVFAPTNAAFTTLGDDKVAELVKPESKDELTKILTYHVVPGDVKAADLKDGQMLETVQGGMLEVKIDGDTVTVGGAKVTQADVAASNGTAHVIDTVLVPAS